MRGRYEPKAHAVTGSHQPQRERRSFVLWDLNRFIRFGDFPGHSVTISLSLSTLEIFQLQLILI